jgi:CBS domain-containing protein
VPSVSTIMTTDVQTMAREGSLRDAARIMQERDIGDVIVLGEGGDPCGIVTDRDIVVRAVAEGRDPDETSVDEICSHQLFTVSPDEDADNAARIMREHAVRRLPVADGGRIIGIVSLGDLAAEKDPNSVLGGISAEEPNN